MNNEVREILDLGLVGDGGPFDELREFIWPLQKENAALHASHARENVACFESLLELIALNNGKTARKKGLRS